MPPTGVITAFIVRAIITMFFGRIVLRTSIRLASLHVRQMKCPSRRESTRHATSLCITIAAHLTLAASAHLSDLSCFDTDSSFWVCDNSATYRRSCTLYLWSWISYWHFDSYTNGHGYSTVNRWWGSHSFIWVYQCELSPWFSGESIITSLTCRTISRCDWSYRSKRYRHTIRFRQSCSILESRAVQKDFHTASYVYSTLFTIGGVLH
jgi:hypothetical protein